jgi:hypothetical protein
MWKILYKWRKIFVKLIFQKIISSNLLIFGNYKVSNS